MKSNAVFFRKENEFDTNPCTIEKIIELSEDRYAMFAQNMLRDHEFISENNGFMYRDDEGRHCLLVLGKGQTHGVLVESEGYGYARYSAHLPNARDFVNTQICQMADKIIKDGTELTESGSWTMGLDDIKEHFDTTVTTTNGIGQLLFDELREREEVAACIMTEDCIEMTYHLEYCPECQQGGISGAMSLMSLMGCNLEDVHLCDMDEDHDLATIAELNDNTLTEDGKKEWSDVLNAKVERIYEGSYGLQIGLSGCNADRLRDFSYMLAGQCSGEDFERWVAKDEINQSDAPIFRNSKSVDLIATFEDLMHIPQKQKITHYFGDYASHYLNNNVDDEAAEEAYCNALDKIRMSSDEFQSTSDFLYRSEIINQMRSCLLSENLPVNEKIVFIPTEPLNNFDEISYETGIIKTVDKDNLSCTVDCGRAEEMEIPLKNVLAKYNPVTSKVCFGYSHAEPLYGMYDGFANDLKAKVQTAFEDATAQDNDSVQSM